MLAIADGDAVAERITCAAKDTLPDLWIRTMRANEHVSPLYFLGHRVTEDTGRLHDEDDDEEEEDHGVLPDRKTDGGDRDLREAHDQTTDDGAGNRADATEDRGHEGLGAEHVD